MPKGIPLSEEEIDRRRHEIFQSAVPLIVNQGYDNTSMQDIAQAAGVGKSTLYDYFPTKLHVLLFVFEEELTNLQAQCENIIVQELTLQEKFTNVLKTYLNFLIKNKGLFGVITTRAVQLELAGREQIMKRRYAYQDLVRSLLEQGIRQGLFRPINTRLTARMLISATEVLSYTTRPTGTPEEMLADVMDIFMEGIKQ